MVSLQKGKTGYVRGESFGNAINGQKYLDILYMCFYTCTTIPSEAQIVFACMLKILWSFNVHNPSYLETFIDDIKSIMIYLLGI